MLRCLFVDQKTFDSKEIKPIPGRRQAEKMFPEAAAKPSEQSPTTIIGTSQFTSRKLWYCRQCGYVVFRDDAPYICPICKAKKEFFAEVRMEIQQKTS